MDTLAIVDFPLLTTLRTHANALSAVKELELRDLPVFTSIYAGYYSLPKVQTLELTGRTRFPRLLKRFPPSPRS